ncbi:hypothetical protein [Arsukibacterium sp.]|uniref:hypothetical protein n=1 Tax=Arsukibacterium sp. TaxID=1977258 RepID=UPI00356821A9
MALTAQLTHGNYAEQKTKQLFPSTRLDKIYAALDNHPEFTGAGVTFIGYNSPMPGYSVTSFERESIFFAKILRNSCRADGKTVYIREIKLPKYQSVNKALQITKSTVGSELTAAGISCTGAAIGWLLLVVEAGGGTVTVGASWAAMPLTLTATAAATFQCSTGIGRSYNALSGNAHYNDQLDESPLFNALIIATDVVQMADVTKTLGNQAVLVAALRKKGIGKAGILKMYKSLSRADRKRLAEEILKLEYVELSKSKKALKAVMLHGRLLDDGTKATKVYSQKQVQALLGTKFIELIGASVTSYASGTNLVGTADDNRSFVIGYSVNE